MDERLNKSNRLPGSEKLTKPEEIGQLSKYLKSIKEVYEESTRLEDQLVGVTGYSTGKIPVIDSLEKKSMKTPTNQGENPDLSQKILGVPGRRVEDKLEEKRVNLEDTRTTELEDEKVKTPDNHGGGVDRLEEVIKKIQDIRDQELGDKRIDLLDERSLALEDTRLDLQAIIDASLENKRVDISDKRETKLENKILNLGEPRKVELEDKRLNIKDEREDSLETKRIELSAEENIKLGDKRLDISDKRETELSDKKVGLEDTRQTELGDKRLDLSDDRDTSLTNKKIELEDDRTQELEDKRLDLSDKRKTELANKKIELKERGSAISELTNKRVDIEDSRNPKLENTKIELTDSRELELGNKKVEIFDERNPKLGEKKVEINDDRDVKLEDTRLDISDKRDTKLENTRLDIKDNRNIELGDLLISITDDREPELSKKKLGLEDNRETELESTRLDLTDERESSLSDKILSLLDSRDPELSDKKLELVDERNPELSDKKIELEDERNTKLENKKIELEDDRRTKLTEKKVELKDDRETELVDKIVELKDNREAKLEDKVVKSIENENGEPDELYDAMVGAPENWNEELEGLEDEQIKVGDDKGSSPNIYDANSLKEYTSGLSDSELYEFAMSLASEGNGASGEHGGWLEKVSGLMSSYLSSDILTPKRAIEFRNAINNTIEMSYFGSQAALRVPVDTSCGTTWAKAEEAVNDQITGTNRRDALDEMIVKMVNYKKSNLPRVPGSESNDIGYALESALKSAVGIITGDTGHPNPINKPSHLNGVMVAGGYGDGLYQAANNRTSLKSIDKVGDTIRSTFQDRYWSSKSFMSTLEELCPIVGKAPVVSLSELKSILKSSPYFTTPGKFMTDSKGSYNTFSLDTNMYWEVTIEPFCSKYGTCSNGGFSFLPAIQEINSMNKNIHRISTNYGYWVPISGFELQKSKISTKSLPLYEGEITYPTGMEFTNELRLTFVDDAWKSWRRYFERCAEVAVYYSNAHEANYYKLVQMNGVEGMTKVDKEHFCIASYKNITFNIKIYILNPQLNLINRFDLLCVLKDFAEEYVGEIDSGGTDLNVTFSIVGENPEENETKNFSAVSSAVVTNMAQQALFQTQKRISGALNSSVGLL